MPEIKNKRGAPREPVHLVAEVEFNGKSIGCAISRDASDTGLLLLTHLNLTLGSQLVLTVSVPGNVPGAEDEPRRLSATVVRCERIPATERIVWKYRVAVALAAHPPEVHQLMQRLNRRSSTPPP